MRTVEAVTDPERLEHRLGTRLARRSTGERLPVLPAPAASAPTLVAALADGFPEGD